MPGRKPTRERRLQRWLLKGSVLGLALAWPNFPQALAQEKKDGLPKLPATKVEGTPTTPTAPTDPAPTPPTDFPLPEGPTGPGTSISGGGIFGSPAVDGYRANSSTSATRIDAPNLSIPATINVVPLAVLRDQQILRMDDVLRDISAATKLGDFRRQDAFLLRGFEIESRDYRKNGFRDPTQAARDFANVQRLEVLKGPASVLYGSGQPAGIVNVITKKPLQDFYENYQLQLGSFGLVRTTVDATGPIDDEGRFLFRVNAAYENSDGFRDFYFNERTFVSPSFTWVMDENTSLNIEYEYLNDRRLFDTGVVAFNGIVGLLPIERYLGQPGDFNRGQDQRVTAWLTHRVNEDLSFRVGAYGMWNLNSFNDTSTGFFGNFPAGFGPLAPAIVGVTPTTLIRQHEDTPDFDETYGSLIADMALTVWTGPLEHQLLFGTELGRAHATFIGSASALFNSQLNVIIPPIPPIIFPTFAPVAPLDPFNPNYNQAAAPLVNSPSLLSDLQQQLYGFYAQDLIDLNGEWQLLAGVRYDIAHTQFTRSSNVLLDTNVGPIGPPSLLPNLGFPPVTTESNDYRLSPRVGLVYQPIPQVLAVYGSYSQSFDSLTGFFSRSPEPLRPATGESYEAGFKADLLENTLSLSMAGFHITKQNVAVLDTATLTTTQIGAQRSQGFETTLVGQLTENWSVLGNYAYVDSRITEDEVAARVGKVFRNVPYNSASVWTRYNLLADAEQTLGVAAGLVFVDNRPGDLAATFVLPGYTRWDGGLFYQRGFLNASLYVENIFDHEYYSGSVSNVSIFPGSPCTARASIGLQF